MLDYEMEFGLDGEYEADFEDFEYEAESEEFVSALASLLPTVAPIAINALSSLLKESEYEADFEDFEYEADWEADWETGPATRKADIVLMNHLANAAADSPTEAEAEAFIGALTSLAAKAVPMISKVAPTLIKGTARVGRQLLSSPATKQLVRTLPTIAEGTVKALASQAAQGQPMDSQMAVRALAHNTSRVLRSPRHAAAAMRRTRSYAPSRRRRRRSYSYR